MKHTIKQRINNPHRLPPYVLEKEHLEEYSSIYIVNNGIGYGIIDDDNNELIACEYDNITVVGFGLLQLVKNGKVGLAHFGRGLSDKSQPILLKRMIPCEYDAIESPWHEGIVVLRKDEYDGMKVRTYFTYVNKLTDEYDYYQILDRDIIELKNTSGYELFDARSGKCFLHHKNQSFVSFNAHISDKSKENIVILSFGKFIFYDGNIANEHYYNGYAHPIFKTTDVQASDRPLIKGFIIENTDGIQIMSAEGQYVEVSNTVSVAIDHRIEIYDNDCNQYFIYPFEADSYRAEVDMED